MDARLCCSLDGFPGFVDIGFVGTRQPGNDGDLGIRLALRRITHFLAIRRTASRSSGEAAGNPASIISTPMRARDRATSSFSAEVIVAPGDCSPSRKVVSKIFT